MDPLIWRLARHPEIPATLADLMVMPVPLIFQAEALADALDRIADRMAIEREADRQHAAAVQAMGLRGGRRG